MLAVQPMCLSSGFSFSCASCHELSLICVYCRAFLWSICSPCAGSQHRTASVPKHPECSQSSEFLITSNGVSGICWYGHKVCALPHLPIPEQFFSDDAAMLPLPYPAITESLRQFCSVLIHNLPLITPLFFS